MDKITQSVLDYLSETRLLARLEAHPRGQGKPIRA